MIVNIRMLSQQLAAPCFERPKELVSWMGVVQAQDYTMTKWAIGCRLQAGNLQTVNEALCRGEILRTHVLRPTWHLVAAEDIRWMLTLSQRRIRSAYASYAKGLGTEITDRQYDRFGSLMTDILGGNKSLTKQEIAAEVERTDIGTSPYLVERLIGLAEIEGLLCSGEDRNNKPAYALLDERVPPMAELHKEEALAELARRYFRSHSPAGLDDFAWWSGLSVSEARQAMGLIEPELIADKFSAHKLFVHESYKEAVAPQDDTLHLLPSYDEYLISYKDRTAALDAAHYPKAFNNFGIFYPVILHNGKIVGNWSKAVKRGRTEIQTTFFDPKYRISKQLVEKAVNRYSSFLCLP